ncbi:hypothetical protein KAR91_76285 [Candidatus Pacearchaeota archaeon]|nr:hypothetical protein [Candidatus Pacearchaeota archaeon]
MHKMKTTYPIKKFEYNGFHGQIFYNEGKDGVYTPILAPYTAHFLHWTSDPGIGLFKCSDGRNRIIPTFAIMDFSTRDLPAQPKTGVLFGQPSSS